ncbi:MAG: hypothetical protein AB1449_04155 [Chloroflexota bacterium]
MPTDETPQPAPDETQPTAAAPSATQPATARDLWRRLRWLLLLIPLAVLLAGLAGYRSGTKARETARRQALLEIARSQYEQGLLDLEAGRIDLARQRFEYVIRIDPSYPGVIERLAETLVALGAPVVTITPVPTPTPNLAPVADLFDQAQAAFVEQDWTRVIDTLLALRAKDPEYRSVEADGMMYLALRNRGLQRIRYEWQLEAGLYDLSRAERFGPLDKEAEDWRTSARYYLLANTYFGLDWGMATDMFFSICVPAGLWDSCDRTTQAAQRYAEQLDAMPSACQAFDAYKEWEWPPDYPVLQPVYDVARTVEDECRASQPPPATPTETPTPTPEGPPPPGG